MRKLVLASKSPRRVELFEKYGLSALVCPAKVDETLPEGIKTPAEAVKFLAHLKATNIAQKFTCDEIIIAADTLVSIDNKLLGKPKDRGEAYNMVKLLSGRTHEVISGICVISGEKIVCDSVTTQVLFRELSDRDILNYIDCNDCYDKAGGYGIQSIAGVFVKEIKGDYYNVVGLPMTRLFEILDEDFGYYAFGNLCKKYGAEK